MNQKPQEIGWMYHMAPKSRVDDDPESYPPPSQIPGLNGEEIIQDENEGVRGWIKDTDSKYIRLAKQGGRPDLLRFKENFSHSKEPRGYPRCEWFYIEDNKMDDAQQGIGQEDQSQGRPYVPKLPEYMVHEAYVPSASSPQQDPGKFRPKRLPYAENTESVYERDGRSATDKTMRIPEARKPGYGIRSGNDEGKVKKTPMPERAKNATRGEARPDHMPEDESAPIMGKLLAGTYEQEWHDRCHQWQSQQGKAKPKVEVKTKKADAMPQSVYREAFAPPPQKREIKHGRRSAGAADQKHRDQSGEGDNEINREIHKMEKDLENKELFKLSKFKNVPSKLDTNRHPQRAQKTEGFVY
ncbi:uncharacterized protein C7orf57-like [Lineus longissimus]|uniref:uncharacterized protein C7orf57-like n=1 Tax=Lineus longissimus TaxID=88925 RepID=UPI002B4C8C5F